MPGTAQGGDRGPGEGAGTMRLAFTVLGPPATKKNSPRIFKRRGGQRFVAPSAASESWTESAIIQLGAQLRRQGVATPCAKPLSVRALVYRVRRTGDLDNFLAAVGDALQRSAVIANDSQIESWDGSRKLLDPKNPRVEITLTEM